MALSYRVIEGWEQLPEGYTHLDVVGIDVDAQDRVYVFTRQKARVIVYERDGSFVRSWGEDFFTERAHGLTVAPDDTILCVDEGSEVIYRFTPDGELLQTIGDRHRVSVRDEEAGAPILYDVRDASDVHRDDGPAGGERLDGDHGGALVGRGEREDVESVEEGSDLRAVADEVAALGDSELLGQTLEPWPERPIADEREVRVHAA